MVARGWGVVTPAGASLAGGKARAYRGGPEATEGAIMRVSTAESIGGFDGLADRAETEPVTITEGGRDRLVLVSAGEYARLIGCDRSTSAEGGPARVASGMPDIWGALRGTTSWDEDRDITEPTGDVWDVER